MSNPFSNANRKVESYSFNNSYTRKIDKMTDAVAINSALRNLQTKEKDIAFESTLENIEKDDHISKMQEKTAMRSIKESKMVHNINRISKIAKDTIFKDILFEVFYNSLLMDDYFLKENYHCLKGIIEEYVDTNGGLAILDKAIENTTSNIYLKKIKSVCEDIALEVCSRKLESSKDCKDMDLIDFDMTDDEKDKLDFSKKEELDVEKISDLVKNKVLTVVKDEKAQQEKNTELIQNIENDLMDDNDVKDEKSLEEAFNNLVINKDVVESSTLFDSLFRDSYAEYITENVAISTATQDNISDSHERSRHYDIDVDEDDISENDEDPIEDTEVNMDLVLTEAITKYTLMETLYTLQLENYTRDNIEKLTHRMLNFKK